MLSALIAEEEFEDFLNTRAVRACLKPRLIKLRVALRAARQALPSDVTDIRRQNAVSFALAGGTTTPS